MNDHPINKSSQMVNVAHIIALSIAILCWILNYFDIVNHEFPSAIAIGVVSLSFVCVRVIKNTLICKNIFCLLLFVIIFKSSLNTGGVYSFDFIGLIAIPIIAIILLNNKWGAIWTTVLLCAVFYSFRLEQLATESYLTQLEKFDLTYFFTVSLLFFLSTIGLVMILKCQVDRKRKRLEEKDMSLNSMSEELKESRRQQNELFVRANHDIKQPLRNIKSFAQLLQKNLKKDPSLSKENLEFLNYIIEGSNELSLKVDELAEIKR